MCQVSELTIFNQADRRCWQPSSLHRWAAAQQHVGVGGGRGWAQNTHLHKCCNWTIFAVFHYIEYILAAVESGREKITRNWHIANLLLQNAKAQQQIILQTTSEFLSFEWHYEVLLAEYQDWNILWFSKFIPNHVKRQMWYLLPLWVSRPQHMALPMINDLLDSLSFKWFF